MLRTARYDAMMKRIGDRTGMEPSSIDAVIATLDPFHDSELDPLGWPDLTSSNSVVQCIKQSLTIQAPGGTADNALWDCHIFNSPYFNVSAYGPAGDGTGGVTPDGYTPIQYSLGTGGVISNVAIPGGASGGSLFGINIHSQPTGAFTPPFTGPTAGLAGTNTMQHMSINTRYNRGASRVFASGVEVHNSTATLTMQGSCMVYRQPLDDNAFKSVVNWGISTPTTSTGNFLLQSGVDTLFVPMPPTSPAQALLLKGSRQWLAKDGSYQVHGLHNVQIPCNGQTFTTPSYYLSTPQDTLQYAPAKLSGVASASFPAPAIGQSFWTEFDTSGVWYTGLSQTTTLTINWNVYIERFPSQLDIDLVVLARASPTYDPKALQFISETVRHLPPGVMVGDNDTGSWFADLIQTGADYVAPLLKAIPHPYAQGISTALTGGAAMVKAFRAKPAAERAAINREAKAAVNRVGNGGTARGSKRARAAKPKRRAPNRKPRNGRKVKFANVARAPRTRGQPQSTWITKRTPNIDEVD